MSGDSRSRKRAQPEPSPVEVRARDELTLAELTDAAGVTVRTVRYYIAEGLLPPPQGAGPSSVYTTGHLDRLRLIQRLKAAYLPLKEIRRRLAGLTDDEVRALLSRSETVADDEQPPTDVDSLASAREYLAMLESPARYRAEPLALFSAPRLAAPADSPAPAEDPAYERHADLKQGPRDDDVIAPRDGTIESPLWRRIPLGEETELVISDRVYARHRERVDWLVRWARKVFA